MELIRVLIAWPFFTLAVIANLASWGRLSMAASFVSLYILKGRDGVECVLDKLDDMKGGNRL